MELSKDAIRLLRWLNKNDDWMYQYDIQKGYKHFNFRSFRALKDANLIDSCVFEEELPEYDEYGSSIYPQHHRISDAGKAYLEGIPSKWLPELREWIAIAISVAALIISIIALISG